MESRGNNFDYKSDLDFPTLGSNVANGVSKKNSPPPRHQKSKDNDNRGSPENSRSMSRARGKKQNWKTVPSVQLEFNGSGQRYPLRGGFGRGRFLNNHAVSRPGPAEEQPFDMGYRSYRSRNRRARGGFAPHTLGCPHSPPMLAPELQPEQIPQMIAIPYTPNYAATYVQPLSATIPHADPTTRDIKDAIRRQIEYYFSDDNLFTDNYMRTNMTQDGFLSIKFIANFPKIRHMDVDIETITQAIEESVKLDVVDRKIIRPVINPLRWPLLEPLPVYDPASPFYPQHLEMLDSIQPVGEPSELQMPNTGEPGVEDAQPGDEDAQPGVEDAQPGVEDARPSGVELPAAVPQTGSKPTTPSSVENISIRFQNLAVTDEAYDYRYRPEVPAGMVCVQDVRSFHPHNHLAYVS